MDFHFRTDLPQRLGSLMSPAVQWNAKVAAVSKGKRRRANHCCSEDSMKIRAKNIIDAILHTRSMTHAVYYIRELCSYSMMPLFIPNALKLRLGMFEPSNSSNWPIDEFPSLVRPQQWLEHLPLNLHPLITNKVTKVGCDDMRGKKVLMATCICFQSSQLSNNKLREVKDSFWEWASSYLVVRRDEVQLAHVHTWHTHLTHGYLLQWLPCID